ncbi:hypothetical protein Rleg2_4157 [Rhizobium leguminosarum bv. trifolii WSM2304]|uniref:Uncharacterized protein n=1 Tax=Rhizobium leguminosarum bv. trifolii (strain WSM2304) TaxID=395492 RepID=A0ABF7QTZ9_RHILW|nr:hypothetical protein [Rhizobium leguminosarum]ACI57419.1 hypothetical protein Rleg2_4157 [Rhizobium leguminosarum bv. trifolii WSM2304]
MAEDQWAAFRTSPPATASTQGPWTKYAAPAAAGSDPWAALRTAPPQVTPPAAGPWAKYAASAPASDYVQPAPPPGEIIHGKDRSYISDHPEINTTRPADDPTGRDTAITMGALKQRGDNADSIVDNILRKEAPLGHGYTFGGADELTSLIVGGANKLMGGNFKDSFDSAQELQRQELGRQRQEHPIVSAATEIAGGLGSGISLAKNGVTIVGNMAYDGVRNILPRLAAGAVEGGTYAGLAGLFGADGGISERVDQAGRNLPLGMLVGSAAVPLTDIASAIAGRVAPLFTRDPEERGNTLMMRSMLQDEQTPEQIASAVEAAQAAGQNEYRAVDAAGRNSQRLAAMAAKTPGAARNAIVEDLAGRQEGQAGRMRTIVTDALGQGDNAFQTEQSIIARRQAAAQPRYDAAYANPPPQGQFYTDMLGRQSVREALPVLERTAAERQMPITDLFTEVPSPTPQTREVPTGLVDAAGNPMTRTETVNSNVRIPTARGWDFIKRELDARVNHLYASGDTTAAEAVKETRNALREQLATDVPGYREALANYSDNSAALEAVQTGRDLITAGNADEARAAYGALNEGQRDLAKTGAAREITQKIDKADLGRDRTRIFNTPDMQGRMDTLVEDPVVRALFGDRLGREQDMARAGRAITGGSSTYENMADGAAVSDAGSAIIALMTGHPIRAAGMLGGRLLNAAARTATGMNDEVAGRISDYLMSADPQQIRSIADLFTRAQTQARAPRIAPAVISAGANAPRSGSGDKR